MDTPARLLEVVAERESESESKSESESEREIEIKRLSVTRAKNGLDEI